MNIVQEQTVTQLSMSDGEVWLTFAQELLAATSTEEVLHRVAAALEAAGCHVDECRLIPLESGGAVSSEGGSASPWVFPLEGEESALLVRLQDEGACAARYARIMPFISLAVAVLHRLTAQEGQWHALLEVLDRIGTCVREDEILREVARSLVGLFRVASVRLFRFVPEVAGFRLEVRYDQDVGPVVPIREGEVYPVGLMPVHYAALEMGNVVRATCHGELHLSEWEREVIFPPQVEGCIIVPFWMTTREMGLLSLGIAAPDVEQVLRAFPMPLLRALLRHAAIALERTALLWDVESARQETELILERAFTGLLVLSPDLVVQRANDAAAQLWGRDTEHLRGMHVVDLFGRRFLHKGSPLAKAMEGRPDPSPQEWSLTLPSGQERHVLVAVTPLGRREMSKPDRYLISLMDVTERQRLMQLRERMLTNMSHELRTPIAVIKGYVELLQSLGEEADWPTVESALNVIEQRAGDLLRLVEMYLDLSYLESQEYRLSYDPVVVSVTVENVLYSLGLSLEQRARVQVDIAPDADQIWTDPRLFRQVLYHLVINALKFTRGRVYVRAWREGMDFLLEVADEGEGIRPEDLPHIFSKFYRGETVAYEVSGSGLGLALVKAAVDTLGGDVSARSEPGKGATFSVRLRDAFQPRDV